MPAAPLGWDRMLKHRIEQSPHRQYFRRSRVDPTASGLSARGGLLLDHLDGDSGQYQLPSQRQPGRTGTNNDHINLRSAATSCHTESISIPSIQINLV